MLTTLTKRAMPMIRYRTGDITTLTTEPCACGRTSARIARIKGRADDMLIIKGVNLYPSEVEAALLAMDELEPHYQLVVDRRTTLARLEVQVEPAPALLERCGGFQADHPLAGLGAPPGGRAAARGHRARRRARRSSPRTRSRARRARRCGSSSV